MLFHYGSQLSFSRFYQDNIIALCYFTEKIAGDRAAAEDIATECFIKLLERRDDFENSLKARAFLYVSANNAAIDHLRMQKRHKASHDEIAYLQHRTEADIERDFIQAEALQVIYQEIERLPGKSRQVVYMSVIEDRSLDEIAEALGMAYKTVQHYKTEGLKALRATLLKKQHLPIALLTAAFHLLFRLF